MPASEVRIALGASVGMETTPGQYPVLGDLKDLELGGLKVGVENYIDHSHTDGIERAAATTIKLGDLKGVFHFDGKSTTYATLVTQAKTRAAKNFRFQLSNGYTLTGPFIVSSIDPATPKDKIMSCGITFTPAAPWVES